MTPTSLSTIVSNHYDAFWPDRPQQNFSWELGPINTRLPGFRVRRVSPVRADDPWIYATVGAAEDGDPDAKEFLLLAPVESPRHVETLAMIANFHADPNNKLSVRSIVDIGRPWMESANADHLLVSLPYPFGPRLEHCEAEGHHVQIVWLVPLTRSEAKFARTHGVEAIEQLLESGNVDVISPARPSTV